MFAECMRRESGIATAGVGSIKASAHNTIFSRNQQLRRFRSISFSPPNSIT